MTYEKVKGPQMWAFFDSVDCNSSMQFKTYFNVLMPLPELIDLLLLLFLHRCKVPEV